LGIYFLGNFGNIPICANWEYSLYAGHKKVGHDLIFGIKNEIFAQNSKFSRSDKQMHGVKLKTQIILQSVSTTRYVLMRLHLYFVHFMYKKNLYCICIKL
jgi:hypothetical protein